MIKVTFKLWLMALVLVSFVGLDSANAQLGNLIKKKKQKNKGTTTQVEKKSDVPPPYAQDYEDETGISGTYYASNDIDGSVNKIMKFQFEEKENGNFINRLRIRYNERGNYIEATLNDKTKEKLNINLFGSSDYANLFSSYDGGWIVEMEPGVYAAYDRKKEDVVNVFAKDKAKLEVYDKETCLAKYQQIDKKRQAFELEKRKKLVEKNEVYKEYVGKVVFVESYSHLGGFGGDDKVNPKKEDFKTTISMGKTFYWGAFLDMPADYVCGKDCEWNMVYEMEGVKTSRVELRNKNARWNKKIPSKKVDHRFFLTNGYTVINYSRWGFDFAFAYCLYQNKDKFQLGKTYKLKATLYTSKDGNDQDKLAEGTIMLVYDDRAKSNLEKVFTELEETVLD